MAGIRQTFYESFLDWFVQSFGDTTWYPLGTGGGGNIKSALEGTKRAKVPPPNNDNLIYDKDFQNFLDVYAQDLMSSNTSQGFSLGAYWNNYVEDLKANTLPKGKAAEKPGQLTPEQAMKEKFETLDQLNNLVNLKDVAQARASGQPLDVEDQALYDDNKEEIDALGQPGAIDRLFSALPYWRDYESGMVMAQGQPIVGPKGTLMQLGSKLYDNIGTNENPIWAVVNDETSMQNALGQASGGDTELDWWKALDDQNARNQSNAIRLSESDQDQRNTNRAFEYNVQQDQINQQQRASSEAKQFALQQEQIRAQALDRVAALRANPGDWIQAWYAENEFNKMYGPTSDNSAGNNIYNQALWAQKNATADPYNESKAMQLGQAMEASGGKTQGPPGYSGISERKPQAPTQPAYLSAFGAKPNAYGEIQNSKIGVASGQLWGRTPWSQQEGLGSYLTWNKGYQGSPLGLNDYQDYVQARLDKYAKQAKWRPAGGLA